jgi:hypothetical protein
VVNRAQIPIMHRRRPDGTPGEADRGRTMVLEAELSAEWESRGGDHRWGYFDPPNGWA